MLIKEIMLSKATRNLVNDELIKIGVDGENLQEKLVFKFSDEFVDGQARAEILLQNGTKSYVTLNKVDESYELPIKSIITKKGLNYIQLVITEGTNDEDIPVFKSEKIPVYVSESVNAIGEAPEGYDEWIDVANAKLNQMDNFDIDATKQGSKATVTITQRDGTEKSVEINDGINGQNGRDGIDGQNGITPTIGDNGNWYLDNTDTGKPSRGVQGETGQTGPAGRDGQNGTNGQDGYSPTVTTSKSDGVTTVTITDKNGEHTATINDGQNGTNGTNGTDGFSPIANVTQSNNVTTISITDKIGTTTASIDLSNVGGDYVINVDDYNYNNPLIISDLKQGMYTLKTSIITSKTFYVKPTNNHSASAISLDNISFYYPFVVANNQFIDGQWAFYYTLDNNRTIKRYSYKQNKESGLNTSNDTFPILRTKSADNNTIESTNTFSGTTTFNTLPTSSVVPTSDTQFVNKKYVDDKMPIINELGENVGNSSNSPLIFSNYAKGFYVMGKKTATPIAFYYKKDSASTVSNLGEMTPLFISIFKTIEEIGTPSENTYFANMYYFSLSSSSNGQIRIVRFYINTSGNISVSYESTTLASNFCITNDNQTIHGVKTFSSIPKLSSYSAPTTDTELVAKKYVDDKIGDINTILATLTTPSNNS